MAISDQSPAGRPAGRREYNGGLVPEGEASVPEGEAPVPEGEALAFVAEMWGVALGQLASFFETRGENPDGAAARADAAVARWCELGYAERDIFPPGAFPPGAFAPGLPWARATSAGLRACGFPGRTDYPVPFQLPHTYAVTEVRLAMERADFYRAAGAAWRGERMIRQMSWVGANGHVPDGEVRWPAGSVSAGAGCVSAGAGCVSAGAGLAWAGECWAIEAELTRKSIPRTAQIMREILARTADYDRPPAVAAVPGKPPRYARVVYLCSRSAFRTVLRARAELGDLAARVEVRDLPASAMALVPVRRKPPVGKPPVGKAPVGKAPVGKAPPASRAPSQRRRARDDRPADGPGDGTGLDSRIGSGKEAGLKSGAGPGSGAWSGGDVPGRPGSGPARRADPGSRASLGNGAGPKQGGGPGSRAAPGKEPASGDRAGPGNNSVPPW